MSAQHDNHGLLRRLKQTIQVCIIMDMGERAPLEIEWNLHNTVTSYYKRSYD